MNTTGIFKSIVSILLEPVEAFCCLLPLLGYKHQDYFGRCSIAYA